MAQHHLELTLGVLRDNFPVLTFAEMIVLHHEIDVALNSQLALSPIYDSLDLRQSNLRKEVYSHEQIKACENIER